MTTSILKTYIEAPVAQVFDLSRDIDFHKTAASQTKETAINGVTSGLISFGESVTWRGKHFGLYVQHTSKITTFDRPSKFTDVMTKGHFIYFAHQHLFETSGSGTLLTDILTYKTSFGIFGKIFDKLLLKKHLKDFLMKRNFQLKAALEASNY